MREGVLNGHHLECITFLDQDTTCSMELEGVELVKIPKFYWFLV